MQSANRIVFTYLSAAHTGLSSGLGGGSFRKNRKKTEGYKIGPASVALEEHGHLRNLRTRSGMPFCTQDDQSGQKWWCCHQLARLPCFPRKIVCFYLYIILLVLSFPCCRGKWKSWLYNRNTPPPLHRIAFVRIRVSLLPKVTNICNL
jgi:hypothetical protein